jgi:hypothetical protein
MALSFSELSDFTEKHYTGKSTAALHQLLWKFNILSKIATAISELENFPSNDHEKSVNQFLLDTDSSNAYTSTTTKLKRLIEGANFKIEAKIGDNPISFEAGLSSKKYSPPKKRINLNEIQKSISKSIELREFNSAIAIIDKIDRFVAGVEYEAQRDFILGLLEVDDDLTSEQNINLKIFIRADLFDRLNFTTLGFDKINDNTIRLQ